MVRASSNWVVKYLPKDSAQGTPVKKHQQNTTSYGVRTNTSAQVRAS